MNPSPPSAFDEFREVQASKKGPGVSGWWEQVIPALDDDQREALMLAAASRDISHRTVATVLGRWGFDVSMAQVAHWRRTRVG